MGFGTAGLDTGSDSPKIDAPWRGIKVHDASNKKNKIHISNSSCLMAGLDLTARYPVCGLGVEMELSELDFVWLAVYFDTNLRPIHAGIQKGAKHTRWYEYGGASIGGFPRTVKTVRRDHIGTDIGTTDAMGYVLPDIRGPEIEYLEYEIEKEVEWLSPKGFLYDSRGQVANNAIDVFKKAMASELTYFIGDPIQVKQWASYTLLGYCTTVAPDKEYPFPNVPLSRDVGGKTLSYYYRQTCKDHLMLQEVNAGGVRALQMVPSFPPYMEACPHPHVHVDPTGGTKTGSPARDNASITIRPSNGIEGTLPAAVTNHADYEGLELTHGNQKSHLLSENVKVRVPIPGENASVTKQAAGPIGASKAKMVYQLYGGTSAYAGLEVRPKGNAFGSSMTLDLGTAQGFDAATFWATAEGMLDSPAVKISYKDDRKLYYHSPDGEIPMW